MFTNWLTGTSSSSNNNTPNNPPNHNSSSSSSSLTPNSAAAASLAAGIGGLMSSSSPPDVILEVGPSPPSAVRFVAHSLVLGMHSGYLRSAIRLDENVHHGTTTGNGGGGELLLFLSNVTAEQFAPLLSYMYTGYLDLNVENIFGVLLATHVLHMPRALEICRSFLARAQTEGYLGASLPSIPATASSSSSNSTPVGAASVTTNSGKIIRPIPSKATLPNYGFLPLNNPPLTLPPTATTRAATPESYPLSRSASREEIEVARTPSNKSAEQTPQQDDEDVEVFIDSSNTETDVEADAISVTSHASQTKQQQPPPQQRMSEIKEREITRVLAAPKKSQSRATNETNPGQQRKSSATNKRDKRGSGHKQGRHKAHASGGGSSSSGLQVAKAPIPASQLDAGEGSKVIIDVASCDGPVRFRRILNTAYGHKPDPDYAGVMVPERSQQSVSLSFHQQMAKTISHQQRQQRAHAHEEAENSESSGERGATTTGGGTTSSAGGSHQKQSGGHSKAVSNEIYVCVYCKHTFKSQYCYQKHAKRHLNPLSLNCSAAEKGSASMTPKGETATSERDYRRVLALPLVTSSKQSASELLRREVRPLDMNVQYYPCKTCGSKFPSYYFVHKHRKLCHADEEAEQQQQPSGSSGRAPRDNQQEEETESELPRGE